MLCLVLGVLDAAGDRVSALHLFRDVAARAGAVEGLDFDSDAAFDRRLFVYGVEAAEDLGVLGVLERAALAHGRPASDPLATDVLWSVDHGALARLVAGRYSPAPMARGGAASPPGTGEPDGSSVRQRCLRALLDEPVVYVDELAEDEQQWLTTHLPEAESVLSRVGLVVEHRAEGWLAVDLESELTDLEWPSYGASQTAALRLVDAMAERGAGTCWEMATIAELCGGLAEEYAGYWPKEAATPSGARRLAADAVEILSKLKLVAGDGPFVPRPAVFRFALARTPVDSGATDDVAAPASACLELRGR